MAIVYLGNAGGGSGGGVQDVTAADTSIVVGGTAAHPTVRTGTLDVIAADHPAAADWSNNSKKITGLANGSAATDAQTYGQGVASLLSTTGDLVYASAANTIARLGVGATGQSLRVASGLPAWRYPPGYELDYVEITSNVTTASATPVTAITGNAVTYDGSTRIALTVYSGALFALGSGSIKASLFEGSTELGWMGSLSARISATVTEVDAPLYATRYFTPSNGSHTYLLKVYRDAGTGTLGIAAGTGGAGAFMPAFMRITVA